jgi:hypothetical protein
MPIPDIYNQLLANQDDALTQNVSISKEPLVLIFSLPRGASTLFQQLVISSLDIGYISNLVARFWRAPYLAAKLDFSIRDPNFVSNFKSSFGNTIGPQEPHEWGWFWRHWFKLSENETYCDDPSLLDLKGLSQKLSAIQSVWSAPLLIDNIFAVSNFFILKSAIPRTLAVQVKRNSYYVCNSHINARLKRYGDINAFYGYRPKNIKEILKIKDPIEQIVAQIFFSESEMNDTLNNIPELQKFIVEYRDISQRPQEVLNNFVGFLQNNECRNITCRKLPDLNLEFRDNEKYLNIEFREKLDTYYEKYFGG